MDRREFLGMLSVAAAMPCEALAQPDGYPSRPVTLLVGGAPGSVPDVVIRPVAQRLASQLGQPVVVENRPGAAGSIAMAALARSAPDGYTLALATMSQAVFNTYLLAKLPYDALLDLEPIAPLVTGSMALAAHPSLPARSISEFVALAKAQPGRLFVAMPQLGSPPHVVGLLLNRAAGIEVTMVPHKSGTEALTAVMSGEIPLLIEAPTAIANHVQSGKLRALVVTGAEREPLLPGTPTAIESGLPVRGEAWIGLVAPRGTVPSIVHRLNRELAGIMATADMRDLMARLSFRTLTSSPDEFRNLIRQDHARWGPTIREAGLRLE